MSDFPFWVYLVMFTASALAVVIWIVGLVVWVVQ